MDYNIISRLKTAADKYECPSFIEGDPIRFPHRYGKARDIEVSAFISAWMAYGSRKVFLEVLERLHRIMDGAGGPYRFVVSGSWRSLKNEGCLYRFYKWADFIALCRRLADVYSRFESLEELFVPGEPLDNGVVRLCSEFEGVNGIPVAGSTSANKRLYMFLRWMVRYDSPVDLGLWKDFIDKRTLVMPLDTHVLSESVRFGLAEGKCASMAAAVRLTRKVAEIFPDDPLKADFALFGAGVSQQSK